VASFPLLKNLTALIINKSQYFVKFIRAKNVEKIYGPTLSLIINNSRKIKARDKGPHNKH
jgi:hypothetical protein